MDKTVEESKRGCDHDKKYFTFLSIDRYIVYICLYKQQMLQLFFLTHKFYCVLAAFLITFLN